MRHGSLFSGIGGFDLAAQWMGWDNVFHCEWNPFGQRVLKYYWPNAKSYEDITQTDFTIHRGSIDILTGGFPCQPYSMAGKRKGKADERHLWPEMLRAIREIAPRYIVGENVLGLVNWDGGLVFDEVQADLEAAGYEVAAVVIPAAAVNAPHGRDRVWFVANRYHNGQHECNSQHEKHAGEGREYALGYIGAGDDDGDVADTESICIQGQRNGQGARKSWRSDWSRFPTQSPIRKRDDGVSNKLLKFVVDEYYHTSSYTSEENRIKNLSEVRERVQSPEVWQAIRGLYSLERPEVLLQVVQLYSETHQRQEFVSPFGEELCKPVLQHLRKHGEFRRSPQGQELQKQRYIQFGNTLSFLPHEVALAARRFETAISKFETWHANESIKAYGNAIVPQVAFEIFKVIQQIENTYICPR